MADRVILEIAVESVAAAQAAERGGADRVELCTDLRMGGVTPSLEMMREARKTLKLPIFVMIRPRGGNVVYGTDEFEEMSKSIELADQCGMDGVVLGLLRNDGTIDVPRTRELVELAQPMAVTFHRAFDECKDQLASLEKVIGTGAKRVLTSGGESSAFVGRHRVRELIEAARSRVTIIPGGGVRAENLKEILEITGATEIHSGLGTVLPYGTGENSAFEAAVRKLVQQRNEG
jgi:copper homeostasis protein